jgi:hypothetical protein
MLLPRLLGQLAARPGQVLNITPVAGATLTEYGHLLETFAVGEILKQVSRSDAPVTVGRFRSSETSVFAGLDSA